MIEQFYRQRMNTYNTSLVRILLLKIENATLTGEETAVDLQMTINAPTNDLLGQFLISFLRVDDSYPFLFISHDYQGEAT